MRQSESVTDEQLAIDLFEACNDWSRSTDRAMQDQEFRIGVSNLGFCSEKVRRQLDRQDEQPTTMWKAFIGTWLGEGLEQAVKVKFPEAIIQAEVVVTLNGHLGDQSVTYQIPGHPDIILPAEGILLDAKTVNGYETVKRSGMDETQKKYQRHGYAYAAFEAGMFGDLSIEDIRVGNVWMDRSGQEDEFYVVTEPFDFAVIEEMTDWLDDVVYHWKNKQEAQKQPPRNVCEKYCGFYAVCREPDTDVEGLITDDSLLDAVALHQEGGALMKRGKQMQTEAKETLDGVRGSTGTFSVRWTNVPGSEIQPGFRRGYEKLEIRKITK